VKTTNRKKNRKTQSINMLISTVMILFIILSAALLIRGKLPFYFDKVVAGEMTEEVDDIIDENELDKTNSQSSSKQLIDNTDDILVVVNKKRYLHSEYKPSDLVVPNVAFSFEGKHDKKHMKQEAANALEELFDQANEEGVFLFAVSGYRSYSTQERLFNIRANRVGEEEANKLSARPGESEHQTGLAMDVSSQSVGFDLTEEFGSTTEGKWVRDNAHKFGFIIRYLKGKSDITGYNYEPWHIRYVGKDVAEKIYNEGITLEEYFGFE